MFYARINKIKVFNNREGFLGLFNRAEMQIYSYVQPFTLSMEATPEPARTAYSTNEVSFITSQVLPTVTTQAVLNITATAATFNGNITSAGDPAYTEKGFVYGTLHNPTIEDTYTIVSGTGTGIFNANITGLTAGTLLYVRAYAKTGASIVYGEAVSFTPNSPYAVMLPAAGLMVQKTDISGHSTVSWSTGNSLCENSTLDGYTDWRLPTKDELAVLDNESYTIGGFVTSSSNNPYYWSSTAAGVYHWSSDFSGGLYYGYGADYYGCRCRCVRNN